MTKQASVTVSLPDGSTIEAETVQIDGSERFDESLAEMFGVTHWPVVEGYEVFLDGNGKWIAILSDDRPQDPRWSNAIA